MAAADYWLCDKCGCKTFYDATLNYQDARRDDGKMLPTGAGDMMAICSECSKKFVIVILDKGIHYV